MSTHIILRPLNPGKNYIRVWKLGNIEHKIIPTESAIEKFTSILEKWDGKSSIDIVWNDAIAMEQYEIDGPGAEVTVTVNVSKEELQAAIKEVTDQSVADAIRKVFAETTLTVGKK